MVYQAYRRRLEIWESNYGRNAGWIVEYQGDPVAVLTDVRPEEMFWDSYLFEITTPNTVLREKLLSAEFWGIELPQIVWRNRRFLDETATFAFAAGNPFYLPGRIVIRGLYLPIRVPQPWDEVVLALRRLSRSVRS